MFMMMTLSCSPWRLLSYWGPGPAGHRMSLPGSAFVTDDRSPTAARHARSADMAPVSGRQQFGLGRTRVVVLRQCFWPTWAAGQAGKTGKTGKNLAREPSALDLKIGWWSGRQEDGIKVALPGRTRRRCRPRPPRGQVPAPLAWARIASSSGAPERRRGGKQSISTIPRRLLAVLFPQVERPGVYFGRGLPFLCARGHEVRVAPLPGPRCS
jgi:hypothetical protein